MRSLMSRIFKSSILGSCALVILGILLIFQSEATIISLSYVIGGILIAIGALAILRFIKSTNDDNKNDLDIVYGIVTVILGIIVIKNPHAIASIIPLIVGFIIIINSANKLQYSLELKKNENNLWKSTMILSLITTICGVFLVLNPFKGAEFITKVVGILILIYAILDIISTIAIKNTVKKIHTAIEESITDAQIIEEKESKKKSKKTKTNKSTSKKKKEKREE
ncbi:MAG: hypothetical protein HFE81_02175 [Bacilli bacterium]|nr:hypothetical protein [Bacilli bacterium]